ncbi:hypothetical protein GYMLUDRAFT_35942 [Collybiopsis luxurians FD-317 M1]|nr:hypothetical protein GYMLUDRAFT_35942 [Collybiopsis luxurians FD-317 M1]
MRSSSSQSEASHTPLVADTNVESDSTSPLKRSISFKLPVTEQRPRTSPEKLPNRTSSPVDSLPEHSPNESEDSTASPDGNPASLNRNDGKNSGSHPRKFAHLSPMLVLENSGSVARDHLACERTFMAYTRTSLAIASTGVALVQLFTVSSNSNNSNPSVQALDDKLRSFARPLGSASICLGIAVMLIGILRYFTVQHALTQGHFPVARVLIAAIALILLVIVTIVFAVLVAGHP